MDGVDHSLREYVASSRLAENYDAYFADTPLFRFDCLYLSAVLDWPRPPEEGFSLLDLGCGTGRHLLLAARNGCRPVGVDLNPHMLDKARERLSGSGVAFSENPEPGGGAGVRLLRGDILRPPLDPRERFNAIIMMFSTFGLVFGEAARRRFLAGLAARLSPGGKLVLHVHNELRNKLRIPVFSREHIDEMRLRMLGKLDSGDHLQRNYRGVLDLRLHFFTADELRGLVEGAGLRVLDLYYLNESRNGPCEEPDRDAAANGFLLTACAG